MRRITATAGTAAAVAAVPIVLFLIAATVAIAAAVARSFSCLVAIRIHTDRSTHEPYSQGQCHHYRPTLHL